MVTFDEKKYGDIRYGFPEVGMADEDVLYVNLSDVIDTLSRVMQLAEAAGREATDPQIGRYFQVRYSQLMAARSLLMETYGLIILDDEVGRIAEREVDEFLKGLENG